MTETKFTPGPWAADLTDHPVDGSPVWGVDAERHSICMMDAPAGSHNEANARLIATAPALYEACRQFVHWYAEDSTEENRDNAYDAAFAALALANGPQTTEESK